MCVWGGGGGGGNVPTRTPSDNAHYSSYQKNACIIIIPRTAKGNKMEN